MPTGIQENFKNETSADRIAWIDVVRGLGILLVVLGHLETGFPERIIYAFHMPLFFFLSGYVHKVQNKYGTFLQKRAIHLLVPYVVFLLLLAPLELHHASHGGKEAIKKAVLDMVWGGDHLRGDYGVFWFVTCLFATQQTANWLLSKFKPWEVAAFGTLSMCVAYINSLLFPWFTLPLDLNVVLGALPFFLTGYFLRKVNLDRWWITFIAILGTLTAIWLAYINKSIAYDMRSANYGIPFLSLILAISCIFTLIWISKSILLVPFVTKLLEMIGAASIGIMFIHKPLPGVPGFGQLALFHPFVAFVVFSFVAYICTVALSKFSLGRALFLGSQKDFLALKPGLEERYLPKQSESE
jgi:fucose 4-O-acetylase-like acetyltransferase